MDALRATFGLLSLLALLLAAPAQAMKVTPFKVRLEPDGYQSSQLFVIENDSDRKIAVELSATTRDVDADGKETNRDASDEFSIYPSQAIVEPHATRSVRVQWQGKGPLSEEHAYRLVAEQLPVDLDADPGASAVRFLVQYRCAVYVPPPTARSDVHMASYNLSGRALSFTLKNGGTAHSLIKNFTLLLTDAAGKTHELSDPKVLDSVNSEVLMPGAERRFSVLLPADAGVDIKDVNFRFAEAF